MDVDLATKPLSLHTLHSFSCRWLPVPPPMALSARSVVISPSEVVLLRHTHRYFHITEGKDSSLEFGLDENSEFGVTQFVQFVLILLWFAMYCIFLWVGVQEEQL